MKEEELIQMRNKLNHTRLLILDCMKKINEELGVV